MSGKPETYGQLLQRTEELLGSKFEAGQLFTHVTQKRIFHMHFLAEKPAPEQQVDLLLKMCGRRRNGEPLQYLLGEWEFYGLPFRLGKGVLIPRQDTESLVDVALAALKPVQSPKVLDLCSGTGCIAVAISHNRPDADVTALELTDAAFEYLKTNIKLNHVPVTAIKSDLREYNHPVGLDMVVSNPPYIPKEALSTLQTEVRHEPRAALDGGNDGLDFYRLIAKLYINRLVAGGWLCFEVGIGQSDMVSAILQKHGCENIFVHKDYTGTPRVVLAQRGNF